MLRYFMVEAPKTKNNYYPYKHKTCSLRNYPLKKRRNHTQQQTLQSHQRTPQRKK